MTIRQRITGRLRLLVFGKDRPEPGDLERRGMAKEDPGYVRNRKR